MKEMIITLSWGFAFFFSLNALGQPGDLTHPAHKNTSKTFYYSSTSIPEGINPLIIYDGLTFFNISALKKIDGNTINSVKKSQDSIVDFNKALKFNATVEITSLEASNTGLKRLKNETNYWIKENPLAVFYFNGKALLDDKDKLDKLVPLKSEDIIEIRTLDSEKGRKLLGSLGENGVLMINTR